MKRVGSIIIILMIIAPTLALIPLSAKTSVESRLLLVKEHFNARWFFYTDKVVVEYNNQNLTITSRLINKAVNTTLVSANSTHVVLRTQIKVGRHSFNITHIWRFSKAMPVAKLATVIEISDFVPPGQLRKAFQYIVVFPDQPKKHATREEWKGKHFFFSTEDMRKSNVKHGHSQTGNTITVDVDLEGYGVVIDPAIGYTNGSYVEHVPLWVEGFESGTNPFNDGVIETVGSELPAVYPYSIPGYGSKVWRLTATIPGDGATTSDTQDAYLDMGSKGNFTLHLWLYGRTTGTPSGSPWYYYVWVYTSDDNATWTQVFYDYNVLNSGDLEVRTTVNGLGRYLKVVVKITASSAQSGGTIYGDLYIDNIELWNDYYPVANVFYEAYSDSNATYSYTVNDTQHTGYEPVSGRIPITISNGITDYPLLLNLSSAIPSGWGIVNFTFNGSLVQYWVEQAFSRVWLKLPSDGSYTVYCYVDSSTNNTGDRTNLFSYYLFYDFFDDGVVDWNIGSALSSVSETNGYVELIANANTWSQLGPAYQYDNTTPVNLSQPFILEFRLEYIGTSSDLAQMQLRLYNSTGGTRLVVAVNDAWATANPALIFATPFNSWNGGQNYLPGSGDFVFKVVYNGTGYEFYKDGVLIWSVLDEAVGEITDIVLTNTRYQTYAGKTARYHYVVIKPYSSTEPSYSLGSIEYLEYQAVYSNVSGSSVAVFIPVGYELSGNTTSVEGPYAWNSTTNYVVFTIEAGGSTVNFTAWNSLNVKTNATYYPWGSTIEVNITLLDPFQNPIANETVNVYYMYSNGTLIQAITLTTDNNGTATTTFTAPSGDYELVVQADYNGTYVGVDHVVIYSTGVDVVLDYTYPYRNTTASIQLTATHTADNSPVNGYAYFKQSPSNIIPSTVEIINGYADIPVDTSTSGIYNLTLVSVYDGEYNYTLNETYRYVVMGVNIVITVSPYRYYYIYNETVQYTVKIYYDTGQVEDFNTTITITRDGAVISDSNMLGNQFSDTVNVGYKTTIKVSVLEADNSTTTSSSTTLYGLDLEANAVRYDTDQGILIYYNVSTTKGILGDISISLYAEQGDWGRSGGTDTYGFQVYLSDYNKTSNTVMLTVIITNYEPLVRTYNVSVEFRPKYYNVKKTVNFTLTVGGYQYDQYSVEVNLTDETNTYIGKIIDLTITINGTSWIYTTGLVPGWGLYKYLYTDTQTVIDKEHSGYALFPPSAGSTLMLVANGLGIYTDPMLLVGEPYKPVEIHIDTTRIYESKELISFNVSVGVKGLLEVYLDDNLIYSKYVEPGNITLTALIPEKPSQVLVDVPIKAVLKAGEFTDIEKVSISVFNTPPTIMLISPPEMSTINGTVNITLYVYDSSGISQVLWKWDYEDDYKVVDVVDGYATITYDTRRIPNGLARLEVKAIDNQGYSNTESFAFYIYNPQLEAGFWITLKEKFGWFLRYVQASAIITGLILFAITSVITYAIYKVRKGRQQIQVVIVEKKERGGGKK